MNFFNDNLNFGSLRLKSNLFLSPLAGYTNLPFRLTVRDLGGLDLATTDLVNARSLLEKNKKAFKLIETNTADSPLAVQLFGGVPEEMRDAALFLEDRGVDSIDINMGCPVKKVCKVGAGSSMMNSLSSTSSLVEKMIESLKIPVTAKMRLGWDIDNITAPDLAKALEDVGIAAIFIHGRTREQGFEGVVNLEGIRKVVAAVPSTPVIGNGDITTPESAELMFQTTGCAGISIGRGAFYNPWIFKHTREYLISKKLPKEPDFQDRVSVMKGHLDKMIEVFGESLGCKMFRKIAPWYSKRFGPAKLFNKKAVLISSKSEFEELLSEYFEWREQFLNDAGELLPQYQLSPMRPTFMDEQDDLPAVAKRTSIPVPKGPVETW